MDDFEKREADLAYTTEEGSRQLVYAAVGGADNEEQLLGAFISLSEVREVSDYALSKVGRDAEDRIWVCVAWLFELERDLHQFRKNPWSS